jgi:hypothetical protein
MVGLNIHSKPSKCYALPIASFIAYSFGSQSGAYPQYGSGPPTAPITGHSTAYQLPPSAHPHHQPASQYPVPKSHQYMSNSAVGFGYPPIPAMSPAAIPASQSPAQYPSPHERHAAPRQATGPPRPPANRASNTSSAPPAAPTSSQSEPEAKPVADPKAYEKHYPGVQFSNSLNRLRVPTHGPMIDFSEFDKLSMIFDDDSFYGPKEQIDERFSLGKFHICGFHLGAGTENRVLTHGCSLVSCSVSETRIACYV